MADRTGLGVLGLVFGGVTAVVLLIAAFVVTSHVDGRLAPNHDREATSAGRSGSLSAGS
jgi:hypothetical protein